ncbi:MAG: FGGY family carbohydrate kinase [Actinomycetota bacterium]
MTLFAGLDVGTSGGRCLVVDERGARAGYGERAWSYTTDEDGFPTLEPAVAIKALRGAVADAMKTCDARELRGIGVTAQRTGVVFLDEDGREIYVGPNTDGRAAAEGIAQEKAHGELIYSVAGRLPAMIYFPARLAWFRAHRPDREVAVALSFGDWIVERLTGVAATEPTQAAEMLVYDVGMGHWSIDLLGALAVPETILPAMRATGEPAGVTQEKNALGLPPGVAVCAGGADTQCAALGMGVVEPGSAFVVAGTTMLCEQVLPEFAADPTGRLWVSPHAVPGAFLHEAHCGEAGAALAWLGGLFQVSPGELVAAADQAEPGAGGVRFYDPWPSTARDFALVRSGGFQFPVPVLALGRGRADFARGLLEGVAFGARAGLDVLNEVDGEPREIAVAGGVARAGAFRAALAGASTRSIRVASETASSALGAAIVAAAMDHGGVREAASAMADRGAEVAPVDTHGYPALYAEWRARAAELDGAAMKMSGLLR